jgi:hypothetical protein
MHISELILSEKIVSFELETDLFMALESLSDSLQKFKNGREGYLKWSIIFGHTALQSAMCLSLITAGSFLVRKRDSYDQDSGDLDNVEWLYQKLQKPEFLPFIGSKTIPEVGGELNQVKRLQIVRNTFIHQRSDLYLFTSEELRELIELTIKLTRFLVSKSERMVLGIINKEALEAQLELVENYS